MARVALAAIAFVSCALAACAETPDLTFASDDASATFDQTAPAPETDSGGPRVDAGAADADETGAPGDTCPATLPPGVDACCGKVECVGSSCNTKCSQCQSKCSAKQICCASGGSVNCVASDAGC